MLRRIGFGIALAVVLACPARATDNHPTDQDLEVGYCLGVTNQSLAWMRSASVGVEPLADHVLAPLRRQRDRLLGFLAARGYLDGKSMIPIAPATERGERDVMGLNRMHRLCERECPVPATPTAVRKAAECQAACREKLDTGGLFEKTTKCQGVARELPP